MKAKDRTTAYVINSNWRVALRWARLVVGRVTVFVLVSQLINPGTITAWQFLHLIYGNVTATDEEKVKFQKWRKFIHTFNKKTDLYKKTNLLPVNIAM